MKKRIALDQLTAGSRFTEDVFIDEKNLLVPAKIAVRQKDLDMLKRWGVDFVMTEGSLVEAAAAAQAGAETAEPGLLPPEDFAGNRELYKRYNDLIEGLAEVFGRIGRNEVPVAKTVDLLAQNLLSLVRDGRDAAISAILATPSRSEDLARSGVNIAIISVVIGHVLGLQPYKLVYLATGSLLHDSGMLKLPESISKKQGALSEDEAQKIKAHPLLSYRVITKEFLYPDDVGLIGLQHHERWDGEGYPRKTAGADIDPLARIVSAADAFEAMVSQKAYRDSMMGYTAMKTLLSDNSRRFDPEVLKAFIRALGIYPLGSTVLLNNAAIARIIENHPEAPLRPRIRLIVDQFGNRFEKDKGESLDLLSEKSLFIARALDPRELLQQS
jgi:HD-GYP domain-containing protein (c-di-GMP phosphodiesterase class II)